MISDPKICTSDLLQQSLYMHYTAVTESLLLLFAILNTRFNFFISMLIKCFIHSFLFSIRKKSLYLTQFTYLRCKLFQVRLSFSGFAHGFLGITVIKVNHSIQKGEILIKRRKALGLNRLKISLDLLHQRK